MQPDQKERHQHVSQHVLLMHISALTTYACFEERTLFHDVLQHLIETDISISFYNVLPKELFCEF
jgi:hypothetical protein